MRQLAENIVSILSDYHCDYVGETGFSMSTEHVLNWANQFNENDRQFVLEEFAHLLGHGIYVSKEKAKQLLHRQVEKMATIYKYPDAASYLAETIFLDMQPHGKSQSMLLALLNEVLQANYGISMPQCGVGGIKNIIYLDDILGTGKTILRDCRTWFDKNDVAAEGNLKAFTEGKIRFAVVVFCAHLWAADNIKTSLKLHFKEDRLSKLPIVSHYRVENQVLSHEPKLNLVYPAINQPPEIKAYLQGLAADKYENRAYRKLHQPSPEQFFTSPANRLRFEDILLTKGLEILNRVAKLSPNQRPLGNTYPNYKTFGTGTLYFTWRNISNTCPIVFWWDNPAHNWHGLFPLHNRGN